MKITDRSPSIPQTSAPAPQAAAPKSSCVPPAPVLDDRFVRPGEEPYVYEKRDEPVRPPQESAEFDQALAQALEDGAVTTVEWNTLLKPEADKLSLQASEDARKLVGVFTDAGVQLETGAESALSKFLI